MYNIPPLFYERYSYLVVNKCTISSKYRNKNYFYSIFLVPVMNCNANKKCCCGNFCQLRFKTKKTTCVNLTKG